MTATRFAWNHDDQLLNQAQQREKALQQSGSVVEIANCYPELSNKRTKGEQKEQKETDLFDHSSNEGQRL
ncbi:hypothetical protein [Pseudomonas sp. FW300-N1A1]|uniref:hypothetical protein n=1 Tax=Pseudomonas sp. FW300-N1A1 TaxID=2075555 RepID=UPI0011AFB47D|nr:hypothetical protein [Pseudomonas sp. FW300-N1A1]